MPACPSCGVENPPEARFCMSCAAPLAPAAPSREQRKVVTVLFCDLVGSTSLGESSDPEVVRARLARTFEELRAILERHGGTVEKFVGDAVMAVFGIPTSHEDDALRAVRAASEMRAAIVEHGLEARIGINTGEVVVGSQGETLVTGDAVNVAARLEQAAPNGEILIGAETRLLVRDAVRVEPVTPLELKGKSEPVDAFRLLEVLSGSDAIARHPETPLVGRERERQRLWRDYADVVADSTCRLFTLLGPAGIGKSRLVADFLERVSDDADVLRGRCLSYGEGITYWPLVEMLMAIGLEPGSVIGTSPAETQLAFRRLLEARAAQRPQVVVIDDLQWAEPVFVDLVEHVADFSRDAPVFLVCIARTELLDSRPGWGGGKLNATSLLLEPLGETECAELMDTLEAGIDDELRERIAVTSAGNPLYVEEILAMIRERGGDSDVAVPPTVQALLQARIDSLDGDVRLVMERGAVEGEVFHRGTVAELAPDPVRPAVESHLATLVRKELIRSTAPQFPEDEGYRFRHLLIRDAAYESLPKATRAELHERFADWLAQHDLVESDEIVGYHLERAHRYRAELDAADPLLTSLAVRAAERLAAAGTGAMDRGDWGAARILMSRAQQLFPETDPRRAEVGLELSYVLAEAGELREAVDVLEPAHASPDPVLRARGRVAELELRPFLEGLSDASRLAERDEARAVLEAADDDVGLARYWWAVGYDSWTGCRAEEALENWERGRRHAEAAGAQALARELESHVPSCLVLGPTPVAVALERAEAIARSSAGAPLLEASALQAVGLLRAMEGRVAEARDLVHRGWRTMADSGQLLNAAGSVQRFVFVERRAGGADVEERVERALRDGVEQLERLGDRSYLPTVALELAHSLVVQGRNDEARRLCDLARERTLSMDTVNFVYLDCAEAVLAVRDERFEEAEKLARRGVERALATDFFAIRGMRALGTLAEVLAAVGKQEEAAAAGARAIAEHERKGDVAGVAVIRERLARAGVELP